MKILPVRASRWLLGVSVAANLVLLAAILISPSEGTRNRPAVEATTNSHSQSAKPGNPSVVGTTSSSSSPHATSKGLWAQLRTDDLKELMRRLESAGFPRAAINQIIRQLVQERFEPRWRELRGDIKSMPYWKAPSSPYNDPKKAESYQALSAEQSKLLESLLGREQWLETRLGHLPRDKATAVQAIRRDYFQLMAEAYRAMQLSGRAPTAADRQRNEMLEQEQRKDIARLLTPAELFEYDLRSSREASILREQTKALDTTESEFRALFPAYQEAVGKALAESAATGNDFETTWRTADAQMQAKLKEVLGPERYADFVQAKDPASAKLNQIVQRLELPLSAARAVVAVQNEITQRADMVKTDRSLTQEQRQTQLAALAQEAAERITGTLGSRGFGAYQQYSGKWLQTLQPKK